jgi:predicted RND superfamily exporter protein
MRWFATVDEARAPTPAELRRGAALAAAAAATALLVGAAWLRGMPADPVRLLPAGDPLERVQGEVTAQFGTRSPVVWVLAPKEGSVWTPAALAALRDLTRQVFTVPGVIAPEVVSLASPNVRDLHATAETLEPTYLMAEVPGSAREIQALRARVEADPNYHGNLVSRDGSAALVVADFLPDADPAAVAARAIEIRDRFAGGDADVYVAGAPVLRRAAERAAPALVAALAAVVAAGMAALAVAGGVAALGATLAAILLALLWSAAALVLAGSVVIPWSAYAALPVALVAASLASCEEPHPRRLALALALASGFILLAFLTPPPARSFGLAGALGVGAAFAAAETARGLVPRGSAFGAPAAERIATPAHRVGGARAGPPRLFRIALLATLAALTLWGAMRLHASFGAAGPAARYLPRAAGADLRAVLRHFPPLSALALRVRGAPGFVKSPAVLTAIDGVAEAARADPAVRNALSLADLVKTVHRGFNDNRPEFHAIPGDAGLIGRYLALAYSPGFRRFVNRSFSEAAIWVYVGGDDGAVLSRVRASIEARLRARPIPQATVDPLAGDGALALAHAAVAAGLAWGVAIFVLAAILFVAAVRGPAEAARALAGAGLAAALACGAAGLCTAAVDLVSLPFLCAAAIGGFALSVVAPSAPLRLSLVVTSGAAAAVSLAGGSLLGVVAGTSLLAAVVAPAAARAVALGVVEEARQRRPGELPAGLARERSPRSPSLGSPAGGDPGLDF